MVKRIRLGSRLIAIIKQSLLFCHSTIKLHQKVICTTLVGLVVSRCASHTGGPGFPSRPGHTKDHHKNGTNCLPAWYAMRKVGVGQCSPTV